MVDGNGKDISVERALRSVRLFLEREWRLALPVALAFLGLPRLATTLLLAGRMRALPQTIGDLQAFQDALPGWLKLLLLADLLATMVGAMALMALALMPRVSVGEAIVRAFRRLPVALGASLLMGAALFLALVALSTLVLMLGGGQVLAVALVLLAMLAGGLFQLLLLPIVVARPIGPVAALRLAWRLYRGALARIAGGLLLFAIGAWVVGLALQVAAGSLLMLLARGVGRPEAGQVALALLVSAGAAVGWGAFALLVAAFYRQRAGAD